MSGTATPTKANRFIDVSGTRVELAGFVGYLQAQDTWCWAAVAASIQRYYVATRTDSTTAHPQCFFVRKQHPGPACRRQRDRGTTYPFDENDCRRNGCSVRDQSEIGQAQIAFNQPGLQAFDGIIPGAVGLDVLQTEIKDGQPVAIRLRSSVILHHLVVVIGYDLAVPSLILWDPAFGKRTVGLNGLQRRLGQWTHTIFTKTPEYFYA
jgi:hypothetical protein